MILKGGQDEHKGNGDKDCEDGDNMLTWRYNGCDVELRY
jgi:hypothetical protein